MNKTYTLPIILVISLFFLGGLSYTLLHVLYLRFLETLNVTRQRFPLPQDTNFFIALPAVFFIQKIGDRKAIQIKPKL